THVARILSLYPRLMISVWMRFGGHGEAAPAEFWPALEAAVRLDGVAMIHVHSGPAKSYRLVPQLDAFLKARLVRARVQLVSAGGDTDTQASAATVYESVLLGSNGASMTDLAGLALVPELIDVYHGADAAPVLASLAGRDPEELREL